MCKGSLKSRTLASAASGATGADAAAAQSVANANTGSSNIDYTVLNALSKLYLLIIRLTDKEANDISIRVSILSRILNAIGRCLLEDYENKKEILTGSGAFDQRVFFRLFSNILQDLGVPDMKTEPNPAILYFLSAHTQVYMALQPQTLPGFAFAWVQLISKRNFMPHLNPTSF